MKKINMKDIKRKIRTYKKGDIRQVEFKPIKNSITIFPIFILKYML